MGWNADCGARAALDLGHAAVDEEFDAGDVAGVVGGEEGDGLGDLVGVADAAEGDAGGHAGFKLVGLFLAAWWGPILSQQRGRLWYLPRQSYSAARDVAEGEVRNRKRLPRGLGGRRDDASDCRAGWRVGLNRIPGRSFGR